MEALNEGESVANVAKKFKIGKIGKCVEKQAKVNGRFQSEKPGNVGYNNEITDWNAFTKFAKEYGGKTQSEMANFGTILVERQFIEHLKTQDSQGKTCRYKERSEERRA